MRLVHLVHLQVLNVPFIPDEAVPSPDCARMTGQHQLARLRPPEVLLQGPCTKLAQGLIELLQELELALAGGSDFTSTLGGFPHSEIYGSPAVRAFP